jgi:hypothetical protein
MAHKTNHYKAIRLFGWAIIATRVPAITMIMKYLFIQNNLSDSIFSVNR